MMSKTHIAVGMAAALAIAPTGSPEACVAAVVGGSVGGVIADCDITPSRAHKDALIGRIIVVVIAVAAFVADRYYNAGLCDYLIGHLGVELVTGIVLFAALTFLGAHTDHRSFTHSIVAMAAFCFAVYLICLPLLPYFVMGYASHLVLDVTNKQDIRLFWPLRTQVSLRLCRAKGVTNTVVMIVGFATTVLLLAYRLQLITLLV